VPPTILIVDDDPDIRTVLAFGLSDAGYQVEPASDGIAALKQIARCAPDLILCDVRMPHLDGIGLATVLAPHTPPIPMILMSANALPPGCSLAFIQKPFALDELLAQIARTLPVCPVTAVALTKLGAV
jgi:two-component system response regulator MprA